MSNKVYVGNLPYSFTNDDLRNLFAAFGAVRLAEIVNDRATNRSRGFGFVELDSADAVQQVIRNLHDTELQGRRLTVTEARDRAPGTSGGGSRPYAGPRPGAPGANAPRGGGGGYGAFGTPRASGGGEAGGSFGGSGRGGRGGAPHRGGGRPRRDESDRWSDGGGGGRRRRVDDDDDE